MNVASASMFMPSMLGGMSCELTMASSSSFKGRSTQGNWRAVHPTILLLLKSTSHSPLKAVKNHTPLIPQWFCRKWYQGGPIDGGRHSWPKSVYPPSCSPWIQFARSHLPWMRPRTIATSHPNQRELPRWAWIRAQVVLPYYFQIKCSQERWETRER